MTILSTQIDATVSRKSRTGPPFGVRPNNSFIEFGKTEANQSIPARFAQQVNKYPNRIAVKTGNVQFTYLELNQYANRIARAILARSGYSAEPVALLIQQGAPLIAAILGVLKTGKFYVPLDPSFAEVKLASVVEHSGAALILTDDTNLAGAGKLSNGAHPVLTLGEISADFSPDDLAVAISPDAIAYILYTSGSTGEPKGVFQSHRNVLQGIMRYTNGAHLCADDRLSLLISASFGASISDIFGALLNGAGLFPFNLKEGLLHLKDWLNNEEITVYHSAPTVFRHFVDTLEGNEQFSKLRLVKLGGETVYRKDFEAFKRHFPPSCLFHVGYGATEMNTICQYYCNHKSTFEGNTVPVGYVMDNTEISLLDEHERQVRPGETGEIAIRSKSLALGYWRQPELTKKAFRSDSKDGGWRLYRTGDIGQMLPDGCLVHLGRKDSQLKIRGHRVEAAEVELALRENLCFKEAVVVGRNGRNGEQQLVAYIVPNEKSSLSIDDLRSALAKSVPDYMIPSAFIILDTLPLTENGKIDRQALPAPGKERPNLGTAFIAPRDSVESQMTHIWSNILCVEPIGVLDNFFALGGDSLSAVQLLSQLSVSFEVELSTQDLIESSTVDRLAKVIQRNRQRPPGAKKTWSTSVVSIQTGGSKQPFFLIPGGLGSDWEFLIYARLAAYLGPEYPCYGLRARTSDRNQRPHASTEEMAADYIREMRAVQPGGPYLLVGECVGGIVAYEMAQQLLAHGQQVALLALLDTPRPTRARQLQFWWQQLSERDLVSGQNLVQRICNQWRLTAERALAERAAHLFRKSRQFARKFAAVSYLRPTPPKNELSKEMWQEEILRTGYVRTLFRYRPKPYTGRITILINEVDARGGDDCGWSRLAVGGLTIHTLPGDHFSYIRDYSRNAAETVRQCLNEAMAQN